MSFRELTPQRTASSLFASYKVLYVPRAFHWENEILAHIQSDHLLTTDFLEIDTVDFLLLHRDGLRRPFWYKKQEERYSRVPRHSDSPFDIINYTDRACPIRKGYVLVFVCFSKKAIQLEPTSDLTTEKFLAAFARFVSGRGCVIYRYIVPIRFWCPNKI